LISLLTTFEKRFWKANGQGKEVTTLSIALLLLSLTIGAAIVSGMVANEGIHSSFAASFDNVTPITNIVLVRAASSQLDASLLLTFSTPGMATVIQAPVSTGAHEIIFFNNGVVVIVKPGMP